jgi:hypothetical protein
VGTVRLTVSQTQCSTISLETAPLVCCTDCRMTLANHLIEISALETMKTRF